MIWTFGHFLAIFSFFNFEENSKFQVLFWTNMSKTCNILGNF